MIPIRRDMRSGKAMKRLSCVYEMRKESAFIWWQGHCSCLFNRLSCIPKRTTSISSFERFYLFDKSEVVFSSFHIELIHIDLKEMELIIFS